MGWHKFGEEGEEKIQTWFEKGLALGKNGKHEDAIECYDKVLEIDPLNEMALKIGEGLWM